MFQRGFACVGAGGMRGVLVTIRDVRDGMR